MKEQSLLPGVIKIAFDAKRVLDSRVSGMAVMSRGIPMAMDSIIWAASNGKMITALAAMMAMVFCTATLSLAACRVRWRSCLA